MAVPQLFVVLLDVRLVVVLLVAVVVPLEPLLLVLVELGLEGVVFEGVFGGHFFGVGGAMGRIGLYELFDFLLKLCLLLVDGHWLGVVGGLGGIGGDVAV